MKKFYTLLLLCAAGTGYSQQGFGTSNPAPSAVVDMVASNKGALLPRVTLTNTSVAAPVTSPANALTVFNTATTGDVTPGYYYWSSADSKWIRLIDSNMPATDWLLDGNTGTTASNFLGTLDNMPLNFKIDNTASGNISKSATSYGYKSSTGSGAGNSAFGAEAMMLNATGLNNTAVGSLSLHVNTDGSANTALGNEALSSNTTGSSNVATGNYALRNSTTGTGNTALGNAALYGNTQGTQNVGVGSNALYNNTTGGFNVAVGGDALKTNTTGNRNVAIGGGADVTANNLTNAIAIGFQSKINASNSMALGGVDFYGVNVGINTATPSNKLHVVGANSVDPVRFEGLQTGDATDKVVVADANGVLKTVAAADIAPATNIYNSNGTLTSERTLNFDTHGLTFTGENQQTNFSDDGLKQIGITDHAAIQLQNADLDANGSSTYMNLYTFADNYAELSTTGDTNGLMISAQGDINPAVLEFRTSPAGGAPSQQRLYITGDGNIGMNTDNPTESFDNNTGNTRLRFLPLNGTANAISTNSSGNPSSSQNQTFTATKTVVADANGVLGSIAGIPLTTEVDGVIGNEVTNATTNGGLTRAGAGTNADPYTLGLTSGTSTGQLMTWNGTAWNPAAPAASTNIYNANGSLTSNRTLTNNGFGLTFLGTNQSSAFSAGAGFTQRGIASSKRASIVLLSDDNDSNSVSSSMQLFQDPEAVSQITTVNDSRGLNIGPTATTQAAPITFMTSTGSNANGTEKMRITPTGNIGINTSNPSEKFDNSGITRLRTLPLNGAANAINTTSGGTASASQDQTFTATRTVVADANGVLGSITGVPLTTEVDGVIGNEVTDATTNGGLVRSGSGTSGSPYTLGLPATGTTGQTMVWDGTTWAPAYLSTVLAGCDGLDATPTNFTISSINATATIQTLTTKSFTLTRKSLVTFSYNVAISNVLTSTGANITDGLSKLLGARITWSSLPGGSPFTVGNTISSNGVPFATNAGASYTFGSFYLAGSRSVVLNAGTYGVNLSGYVFAQDNGQGVRGTFNGTNDQFDVIAVPVQ